MIPFFVNCSALVRRGTGRLADYEAIADPREVYREFYGYVFRILAIKMSRLAGLFGTLHRPAGAKSDRGFGKPMDLPYQLAFTKAMRQYGGRVGKLSRIREQSGGYLSRRPREAPYVFLRTACIYRRVPRFSGRCYRGPVFILKLRAITVTSPTGCHLEL